MYLQIHETCSAAKFSADSLFIRSDFHRKQGETRLNFSQEIFSIDTNICFQLNSALNSLGIYFTNKLFEDLSWACFRPYCGLHSYCMLKIFAPNFIIWVQKVIFQPTSKKKQVVKSSVIFYVFVTRLLSVLWKHNDFFINYSSEVVYLRIFYCYSLRAFWKDKQKIYR